MHLIVQPNMNSVDKVKVILVDQDLLIFHNYHIQMILILNLNLLKNKYLKEDDIKDINVWINVMDMELCFSKMEDIIKVNGKEIKCMVGVNYIMKAEDWHIKVIGVTTNSMDMEKFTTIILSPLNSLLTTLTSIF